MPLIEELTTSGQFLFRWRSYLPLAFIALSMVSMVQYAGSSPARDFRLSWDFVCLGVGFIGVGIRACTVGHTPKGTSGRNTGAQVAETLNTTGIYSVVRHPLYLGNFFMGLGVALFPGVWWLVLIYTLAFWLYYERIMFAEEAFLRQRFGTEYLTWASATPAFIPDLRGYARPSLPFSLRNVLRREYNGAYAVVVALFMLDAAGEWSASRHLGVHERWMWIFLTASLLWGVARTVKRHTTWLNVAGR